MFKKGLLMYFLAFASIVFLVAITMGTVYAVNIDEDSSTIKDLIEGKGIFKFDVFPHSIENNFDTQQSSLNISANGKTLITASEVTEVNWPNIKVKIWGLILSVQVMPDARIIGGVGQTADSNATGTPPTATPTVAVGDKVDILGDTEKDSGLVHAKVFRDRSQSQKDVENLRQRIQDLIKQINELRAKINSLNRGF